MTKPKQKKTRIDDGYKFLLISILLSPFNAFGDMFEYTDIRLSSEKELYENRACRKEKYNNFAVTQNIFAAKAKKVEIETHMFFNSELCGSKKNSESYKSYGVEVLLRINW